MGRNEEQQSDGNRRRPSWWRAESARVLGAGIDPSFDENGAQPGQSGADTALDRSLGDAKEGSDLHVRVSSEVRPADRLSFDLGERLDRLADLLDGDKIQNIVVDDVWSLDSMGAAFLTASPGGLGTNDVNRSIVALR